VHRQLTALLQHPAALGCDCHLAGAAIRWTGPALGQSRGLELICCTSASSGGFSSARPERTILIVTHSLPAAYVLMARAGRDPAPHVPLVEYAKIHVISAPELAHAVARLEGWCAAPTLVVEIGPPSRSSLGIPEPAIVNLMVQYLTTVDRAFAALADPTRRAVLERLGAGTATISELAEPFGMSLTGMKKHVRLLEEAQLITTEKVGRVRRCMLVPYAFEGISTWLQRLDRFAQVVERTKGER
jgi:DNA-binding transcriptional ArsR family regulator